jgi:hypothetical protein
MPIADYRNKQKTIDANENSSQEARYLAIGAGLSDSTFDRELGLTSNGHDIDVSATELVA